MEDGFEPHVTTRYEDWCEHHGVHPEAWGAWEFYCAQERAQERQDAADGRSTSGAA